MINNKEIDSIPQGTLETVVDILKRYRPNLSEGKLNAFLNSNGTTSKTDKILLNTKELTNYTNLSNMSISRARQAGDLKCIKTNPNRSGRVLYDLEDVNKWLDSKRQ